MRLLNRDDILASVRSEDEESLFFQPLLDEKQINAVSVDLRLGTDFLVSVLTRRPSIELGDLASPTKRGIASYFQETRRDVGESFVIYPDQLVLAVTLEYVSVPVDVVMDVLPRSSFSRLGVVVSGMIQPGYRGCLPLELFNHGSSPVELVVGSRVCQVRLYRLDQGQSYLASGAAPRRKYFGAVRPVISRADRDAELSRLLKYPDHLR